MHRDGKTMLTVEYTAVLALLTTVLRQFPRGKSLARRILRVFLAKCTGSRFGQCVATAKASASSELSRRTGGAENQGNNGTARAPRFKSMGLPFLRRPTALYSIRQDQQRCWSFSF